MRTIIAGTRTYGKQNTGGKPVLHTCKGESLADFTKRIEQNKQTVFDILDDYNDITTVLSGLAKGPDTWGKQWAERNGIPVDQYPPDWDTYGRGAGFRRNAEMVANADRVIAFHDGFSRGTRHTLNLARQNGLQVIEYIGILT